MRIRENKVKKIIFALPRKILGLILILMILYNVINTVYGIFNKKLELQIGETKIYVAEDKTMLPTIKPNDLILAKQCTPEDLNLEDIIIFDENGIIKKGLIIRHLVLPNHLQNSKHILKWIKENMPEDTYVSVMAQYFPTYKAKEDELLNRKLTKKEYKEIEKFLYTLDLKNGYIQELGEHEEEYVPDF